MNRQKIQILKYHDHIFDCKSITIYQSEVDPKQYSCSSQSGFEYSKGNVILDIYSENIKNDVLEKVKQQLFEIVQTKLNNNDFEPIETVPSEEIFKLRISINNLSDIDCPKTNTWEEECIHISSWNYEKKSFKNYLAIKSNDISFIIDYPLAHQITFRNHSDAGFTFHKVIDCIVQAYKKIYEDEETSLNDNETMGVHGIWEHDIEDLFIETLFYNSDTGMIEMFIGS